MKSLDQCLAQRPGRLRPSLALRRELRRSLAEAQRLDGQGFGDENLKRLCSDSRRILACLRQAEQQKVILPDSGKRILKIARNASDAGERQVKMRALAREFGGREGSMRELQALPDALRIAFCEGMAAVSREMLKHARSRQAAERWLEKGGRIKADTVFLEHAIRISSENGDASSHKRLLERCREERTAEEASRSFASAALRFGNLMQLYYLLENEDWQAFFEENSAVEAELRDHGDYAGMDEESRSRLRRAVEAFARAASVPETAVVRWAGRLAGETGKCICYFLYEDAGRRDLRARMGLRGRLRRQIPDPSGRITVLLLSSCFLIALLLCCIAVETPLLWLSCIPAAWMLGTGLIGRFYSVFLKPRMLLKMQVDALSDDACVLVALPVLLSSAERAREMVSRLEVLGCAEKDKNIDYLLLGDFRDGESMQLPDDEEILDTARQGIAALNARAEREKYFYLHRGRSYRAEDGLWMGENRKRGALMALNRLILGKDGVFSAENAAANRIAGRYKYVVTLDADTEYLPGTIQKLAGAMLHPLNRNYAILQPCMQATLERHANAYQQLIAAGAGVDSYPVQVSDFYQDMTGRGNFCGKGIYDVRAFAAATEGALPDAEILSHDLIEGILAGAGFLGDVCFYDGAPDHPAGELKRMHRWTRGDWQLLRVIFGKRGICAVDRLKMTGNLIRSLQAPALLSLLVGGIWLDAPGAFLLGLLAAFLDALLSPGNAANWKRSALRLAMLPAAAVQGMDAACRALWRLFVSRKRLMEWVPAADAKGNSSALRIPGRAAALLLLPGLLRPFWIPAALGLALLFWVGMDWAQDLSDRPAGEDASLDAEDAHLLRQLAAETWHFFADFVPENGMPPDNVQFDPPAEAAQRTSPTNIGLYLMSCLSAQELGLISSEEMCGRMHACAETLLRLKKWRGQLYNWYDIASLEPLKPEYVSSVDSGNLAAALLVCSRGVAGMDDALSRKLRRLAEDMQLNALYDSKRKLFYIGMDAANKRISDAHYDLYASESRLLSYVSVMLGQVPVKHWHRLSRPAVPIGGDQALLSWSGTMFEYLMPELLLETSPFSLAGVSNRAAVRAQMEFAKQRKRPWGVSESGWHGFDMQLNYQYRAFGLPQLALSGAAVSNVCAPYASALALCCAPVQAAQNLREMRRLGWSCAFGMYESADYRNGDEARLVKSCMAHHQGMILCAIANALRDGVLCRRFMEIPQARAYRLLLQEKPYARLRLPYKKEQLRPQERPFPERSFRRHGAGDRIADTHLLHGGGTTALVTARGAISAWQNRLQLNRFSGELLDGAEGMFVHIENALSGEKTVLGASGRAEFDAGCASFTEESGKIRARMEVFISPENGALRQRICMENTGNSDCEMIVTGCFAVALANDGDMRAHPAFQNIFIESSRAGNGVQFHRRPREKGREAPDMIYTCSMEAEVETSCEKLLGRTGRLDGEIAEVFSGTVGAVLNPCAALKCRMRVPAGEKREVHFALMASSNCREQVSMLESSAAMERAQQLARAHARSALHHAGVEAPLHRLLQRAAALILDAHIAEKHGAAEPMGRESLWCCGISGENPLLLMEIRGSDGLHCLRDLLRAHNFYRMMGIETDIAILNHESGGYQQPLRDEIENLIASSHLHDLRGLPGGVFLLDGNMPDRALDGLRRFAALRFDGGMDMRRQLSMQLECLHTRETDAFLPMDAVVRPIPDGLRFFNGYGGFDDGGYVICLRKNALPPAPWCNIIATDTAGAVLSDRGGGFAWRGNSRSGRITPFRNDTLREGWGWMFYLADEKKRRWMRLLPGDVPMTDFDVRFSPGICRWDGSAGQLDFSLECRACACGVCFDVEVENRGRDAGEWKLSGAVDWLLGTDTKDMRMLKTWTRWGACFAAGAAGVGCFASDDPLSRAGCSRKELINGGDFLNPRGFDMEEDGSGWTLVLPIKLKPGEGKKARFLLGSAASEAAAQQMLRDFRSGRLEIAGENPILRIETPDAALNCIANGFLQAQLKYSRLLGRTGFYQPGGAYGFRDQLQDMLPLIYTEPKRVREHLLRCAARQFIAGDVLHWWHEPAVGVRTNIRDDLLFLPYVAAKYVQITGDADVLQENVPYLRDVGMPEGSADIYAAMEGSDFSESLHRHCMRAFHRAADTGEHGLCRMGSGDWNDGMNRIGPAGRGESVWLTEFLSACAVEYAKIAPDAADRAWLCGLSERLCAALEQHGWDGEWYLRAFADDGSILGGRNSENCRIDLISQAWAVFAGLEPARQKSAAEAAWRQLADEKLGLVRLLTPAFDGEGFDPGYIAAYPPGIRENGAQYTHAACWFLLALIRMGDAERAHRLLSMLLPVNHARNRGDADRYRTEPYVLSADVYTHPMHAGRGGWSWYTGSAAWLLTAVYELLGFERRGNRVRLNALLGEWQQARLTLHFGSSRYELVCCRDAQEVSLDGMPCAGFIEMKDDGRSHRAVFPSRRMPVAAKNNIAERTEAFCPCYNGPK